jgi:hypothetical protein
MFPRTFALAPSSRCSPHPPAAHPAAPPQPPAAHSTPSLGPRPTEQSGCCALVTATATGGTVACGTSGLVLTVAPSQFAAFSASVTVTGKSGSTVSMNPATLIGKTCSSRYGAATWGSASGATTLSVQATGATCTTLTNDTCQGLVTRLTPRGKLAVALPHTCTIRSADGAVLCSGENSVSLGGAGIQPQLKCTASKRAALRGCVLATLDLDFPPLSTTTPFITPPQQAGQLGVGQTSYRSTSTLMPALAPGSGTGILTGATWVAASNDPGDYLDGHTCVCLATGEALCWGSNTYGQVTRESAALPPVPGRVPSSAACAWPRAVVCRLCLAACRRLPPLPGRVPSFAAPAWPRAVVCRLCLAACRRLPPCLAACRRLPPVDDCAPSIGTHPGCA